MWFVIGVSLYLVCFVYTERKYLYFNRRDLDSFTITFVTLGALPSAPFFTVGDLVFKLIKSVGRTYSGAGLRIPKQVYMAVPKDSRESWRTTPRPKKYIDNSSYS